MQRFRPSLRWRRELAAYLLAAALGLLVLLLVTFGGSDERQTGPTGAPPPAGPTAPVQP